jgi:cupin fold WbuC family metalloprotein
MGAIKMLNSEVFVADDPIVKIDPAQMADLKAQAARNPRRRARICAHKDTQDRLHEMLLVMAKDMYVHPHKHLKRSESFHVIEGAATIVFFDETGLIEEAFRIGDFQSGHVFYFRNDEPRWHTQIIASDFLVVHETTNGPFNRADSLFASWAPNESDTAAAKAYMEKLKRDVAQLLKP